MERLKHTNKRKAKVVLAYLKVKLTISVQLHFIHMLQMAESLISYNAMQILLTCLIKGGYVPIC